MALPAFAADAGITPYALIHCEKNGIAGKLVTRTTTEQIASETRNCQHGRVGYLDKKIQYIKVNYYTCTGCNYSGSYAEAPYWTGWSCI